MPQMRRRQAMGPGGITLDAAAHGHAAKQPLPNHSTEELKLRQAARKVRVGVQLSGGAASCSAPDPAPPPRRGRKAKPPPPELALELPEGAAAAEGADKVSPLRVLPSMGQGTGISGKMKGALKSASAFYVRVHTQSRPRVCDQS